MHSSLRRDLNRATLTSQFEKRDLPENEEDFFHGKMRRSSGAEFRNHGEERDAEILSRLQGTFGVR